MIHLPAACTVSASAGTGQAVRGPAQAIRPSRITTTASRTGAAAVPSTRVAPTKAAGGGAAPGVGNAVVTATFQPSGVRTNTRSLTPRTLPVLSTTR
jgi:hypothetical protein